MHKISVLQKEFLADNDLLPRSSEIYRSNLMRYFLWINKTGIDINNVSRSDIIKYKQYLEEKYTSIYTVRNYFTSVKLFYSWAERSGYLQNIAAGIKQPRYVKKLNKMPLFPEQVKKLLGVFDKKTEKGFRNYAIVYTMVVLGLRVTELCRIDISDIVQRNGKMLLNIHSKGKRNEMDVMAIPEKLWDIIEKYLTMRDFAENDPLFVVVDGYGRTRRINIRTVQGMVKAGLKKIGLDSHEYCSHSLRHTTATIALMDGKDVSEVQGQMRHSSPVTTEVYLRFIRQQQVLKGTIGRDIAELIT